MLINAASLIGLLHTLDGSTVYYIYIVGFDGGRLPHLLNIAYL